MERLVESGETMEMEMINKVMPSCYVAAYDDISLLSEEAHRKAYEMAIESYFQSMNFIFNSELMILIPESFRNEGNNEWILINNIMPYIKDFANFIYFLDKSDFLMDAKTFSDHYRINLNADPVVFSIEKVNKKKKKSFFSFKT